jgi:HTH-type transcriptional regulator / antitoxin HigA
MSSTIQNQYTPNYVAPPGETLLETLEALGMSQADLADRTGRPKKTINEIIHGKATITPETALQLERVLRVPASFWNNLERNYREFIASQEEQKKLQQHVEWLKQIPVKDMSKRGWIQIYEDKIQQLREVLTFFGVVSPKRWEEVWGNMPVAFRESSAFEGSRGAITAWLRRGEIEAQSIYCAPYDAGKFKKTLRQIRSLTNESPEVFQPEVVRLCSQVGVAVVFVPELPKTHICGATRWLKSDKALIQLSLRHKTDDHLWFAFFHEAGHVLLHGKQDIFLEINSTDDPKEQEANNFAANFLIPEAELQQFIKSDQYTQTAIQQFATKVGIAPGIVVGRLQHTKLLPHTHCNDLKCRFTWAA